MKELNRQIALGHQRGRDLGRIEGFFFAGFWSILVIVLIILFN